MSTPFDPILVEVLKHELVAVSEEMALAISRTGRSTMVKNGDFAVALCDAQGRVMGPGYASALQMVNFAETMAAVLAKWGTDFAPGDVVVANDPFAGAGHLPDVAVVAPVYWRDRLAAFTIAYSHHTDIGGRFAGGMSTHAAHTYEEGLRLPTVKLCRAGRRDEALMETVLANVRAPEDWRGDVDAKIAGCWRGEQELRALLDKYGLEAFEACGRYLAEYAERIARAAIRAIPDGRYAAEDFFEDDGFGGATQLPLKVALTVQGDTLAVDFDGTGPQAPSAINVPLGMSKAMVYGALKMVIGPEVMLNAGYLKPITVRIPEGTLLNPRFPGAVGGRAPLMFRVSDLVLRALAQALPERVPVTSEGGDVLHFTGNRPDGGDFALMDIFSGGWGARLFRDGIDGANPMLFGGYGTVSAEVLEREYPLVVEGFGFVPDSAGAGRHRGAQAVYRQWRFLQHGHIMVRTTKPARASAGLAAGASGALSCNLFRHGGEQRELPRQTHLHLDVAPGDMLYHATCGAGGHGDPWERAQQRVLDDVLDEKLTPAAARTQYGVVIDAAGTAVDAQATAALRSRRPQAEVRQ